MFRRAILAYWLSIALASFAVGACVQAAQGAVLTPAEISESGTRRFSAQRNATFDAMLKAIAAEGYAVAVSDKARGVIITECKLVGDRAVAHAAGGSAYGVGFKYYRSYEIAIDGDGNRTKVTAVPKLFENDIEISDKAVWALDGAAGERALWSHLFERVAQFLS
ncbi:MAG: hypothetical protein R3B13_40275 [Polyangiaceae bacterium]